MDEIILELKFLCLLEEEHEICIEFWLHSPGSHIIDCVNQGY